MPSPLTSLQVIFTASEYDRPLEAAVGFVSAYSDRDIIIAAVDEAWHIVHIRDQLAALDPDRAGILITVAATDLPAANEALLSAMTARDASIAERRSRLQRDLRRRLGRQYRVAVYFPPRVLAEEPGLQNLPPGDNPKPEAADPMRQPAAMFALLAPVPDN